MIDVGNDIEAAAVSAVKGTGKILYYRKPDWRRYCRDSSAFNGILPDTLIVKLLDIGLPDLLLDQRLSRHPRTESQSLSPSVPILQPQHRLSTGLIPLLYTLHTHDCVSTHPNNKVIRFADDTTLVGPISGGDKTAYGEGDPVAGGVVRGPQLDP